MKPLRFLATGDLQVHNWSQFNYTRPDGMGSRLYYTLKVFDIILEQAIKLHINKVLLNGDIFEDASYIDVEVYNAVYEKLELMHRKGLDVVINIGNHDVSKFAQAKVIHSLKSFGKIAQIIETPTVVWGYLGVIPWMANPECIKIAVKGFRHIVPALALHCGVQGARTGPKQVLINNPIQLRDLKPDKFAFILLSDYHTQQELSHNVLYMGSPLQHNFGEIHKPVIWDVQIVPSKNSKELFGKWKMEAIPTNLPRFHAINIKHLSEAKKQFRKFKGDYFRVQLPADSKLETADIIKLARKYHHQVQVLHTSAQLNMPESIGVENMQEVLRAYVRLFAPENDRERLLKLGQKLLEREA
jgi:DNA repair exonuclease SbcCD nuclease subunit